MIREFYIDLDKVSKIVLEKEYEVYWGGKVKYYPEERGWLNVLKSPEGYYTEGERYSLFGIYHHDFNKEFDKDGYLYHKPNIKIYAIDGETVLYKKYFDTQEEMENYFKWKFQKFAEKTTVVRT